MAKMAARSSARAVKDVQSGNEPSSEVLLDHAVCTSVDQSSDSLQVHDKSVPSLKSAKERDTFTSATTTLRLTGASRKRSLQDVDQSPCRTHATAQTQYKRSYNRTPRPLTLSSPDMLQTIETQTKISRTDGRYLHADRNRSSAPCQSFVNDGLARDAALREYPRLYQSALHMTSSTHTRKNKEESIKGQEDCANIGRVNIHRGANFNTQKSRLPLEATDTADQVQNLSMRMRTNWQSIREEAANHASDTQAATKIRCTTDPLQSGTLVPVGSLAGEMRLAKSVTGRNEMLALFAYRGNSLSRDSRKSKPTNLLEKVQSLDKDELVRIW